MFGIRARATMALAIVAPLVLTLGLLLAPSGSIPRWGLPFYGCLVSAPGLAGILLSPCAMRTRLVASLAYVPLVSMAMLAFFVFTSCALFRDCP